MAKAFYVLLLVAGVAFGASSQNSLFHGDLFCKIHHDKLSCKNYQAPEIKMDRIIMQEQYEPGTMNSIAHLEFKHGNTPAIHRRAFYQMKSVRQLVIHNMSVSSLDVGAFDGLSRIKLLDLSHNNIRHFDAAIFANTNVRHLRLDGNPNLDIPTNSVLLTANKLLWLSMRHCGIQHLPGVAFQGSPHLSHLDLSSNRLEQLPEVVFENTSLSHLDLSHNNLRTLSMAMFQRVPGYPKMPRAVVLTGNKWHCDCQLASVVTWLAEDLDTHYPTSDPARSRLQVHTTCTSPEPFAAVSWNKYEEWNCDNQV